MTIQEAAAALLKETGKPMSSKEIAELALSRGMVSSNAKRPVDSHAQTIEKNIRDRAYNRPELIFVHSSRGRLIGLPHWRDNAAPVSQPEPATTLRLPKRLVDQLLLATQARIAPSLEETAALVIQRGLAAAAPEIKAALLRQLADLDGGHN